LEGGLYVEVIDECQSLVAFPSDVMKWNDWQLLGDEIGKGAYGRVYKGLDLENGDFVAIKQVSLENIPSEDLASIMVGFLLLQQLPSILLPR
jgi:hypothetical protein